MRETSNRLANVLSARGIRRGDRVAILLPQAPAVAAAHVAIYKLGAIALPLAMLFGVEAISYRLADSGARALITNAQGLAKLTDIRDALPALVLSVDGPAMAPKASSRRWRVRLPNSRRSTPRPTIRR